MLLQLGEATFDVSTRSLVAAHIADGGTGDDVVMESALAQVNAGADILIVPGEDDQLVERVSQIQTLGVPLWISSTDPGVTVQCARSGASIVTIADVDDGAAVLELLAEMAVTFAIDETTGHIRALPLGIAPASVVATSGDASRACGSPLTGCVRAVAATTAGSQVAAVMEGARIIVCEDVQPARRTLDTISVLLQRRGHFTPTPVINQGAR